MLIKRSQADFEKLQAHFALPMVLLALVLLGIIIIREVYELSDTALVITNILDWLIWLAFAVELVTLTYLAPKRLKYLISHWYDVLIVVLPAFRIFKLVELVRLIRLEKISEPVLRAAAAASGGDSLLARVVPLVVKGFLKVKVFVLEHHFNYIISILIIIVVFLGSLAAIFERTAPDANITTVYEGIWWSIVSITTVGYGDRYPITWPGRFIGVLLMTLGITSFSLLTANIASFMVGEKDEEESNNIKTKLHEIESKLDQLLEQQSDSTTHSS